MNKFETFKFKEELGKFFEYTLNFQFLELVVDVINRIDDDENEEDIYETISSTITATAEKWTIMRYYQSPEEANYSQAYVFFENDIINFYNSIKD